MQIAVYGAVSIFHRTPNAPSWEGVSARLTGVGESTKKIGKTQIPARIPHPPLRGTLSPGEGIGAARQLPGKLKFEHGRNVNG